VSYNDLVRLYNGSAAVTSSYVMKVSSNGQVSIPADTRARWMTDRVLIVDLGDRIVLRPLPADPVSELRGKYRGRGPSTSQARNQARNDEAAAERRRR
jgi:bifunctional DNA-binding transcriptional regulator/antitoxin component of YhaV-PrlF toxin-antitoxin module